MEFLQNSMVEIIFAVIGLGLAWTVIKFNTRKESEKPSPSLIKLPYEKGLVVLTDTEQKFYHALEDVLGGQYTIFPKVRLIDFIDVKGGMDKHDTKFFADKISRVNINFLLCTPLNTKIVIALELDDIVDTSPDKKERFEFIEQVCSDIGFPLLSFKVRGSYEAEIEKQLGEAINFKRKEPEDASESE